MANHGLSLATFVILGFGAIGLYLMLPRGSKAEGAFNHWCGAALGTLSLVLIAVRCGAALSGWSISSAFFTLAVLSVASAAMTVTSRNPVYCALWFAVLLLSNSGLYLLQDAEFLAAATIIIYAGAIIVTFLFVIMLAQPRGTAAYDRYSREPMMSCLAGAILASTLVGTLHHSMFQEREAAAAEKTEASSQSPRVALPLRSLVQQTLDQQPDKETSRIPDKQVYREMGQRESSQGHVASLGRTLFLTHYLSIEIIGVLLLVAVVGAVLIANHAAGATEAGSSARN